MKADRLYVELFGMGESVVYARKGNKTLRTYYDPSPATHHRLDQLFSQRLGDGRARMTIDSDNVASGIVIRR